jgi:hypothetical protein
MTELVPVDHDPFAAPSSGSPLRITVGGAEPKMVPVDHDPFATGLVKAAGEGLASGVSGLVGLPGDLINLKNLAVQKGAKFIGDRVGVEVGPPKQSVLPTARGTKDFIEQNVLSPYKPQTTAEEYVRTFAEFAPGAAVGPGGPLARLMQVAVPAAASETAGQYTKGGAAEPYARLGGGLLGAGAASVATRPSGAARALRDQLPPGVTEQHVQQAQQLMQEAAQRGIRLTWPEALSQVAQRPVLTNTMRHLEASPQTEARMAEVFAGRPQAVEGAVRQQADAIAPPNPQPSTIGPAVGQAADDTLTDVRGVINQATDPYYQAAEAFRLNAAEMARVRAIPGFQEAAAAVRNNPQLNRYVAHLPDDSVGFLNEVKKQLDQSARNATAPIGPQGAPNAQVAAGYTQDARAVRQAAIDSTGRQTAPGANPYEVALNVQEDTRRRFLEPLLQGPLGRLADSDRTTRSAINVLFPANPIANSADEITTAVTALAHRNPTAARQLVRAHIEATFNESAQALQSGANQAGGAKFRAALVGNRQQAENLEAAVRALPHGDQVWTGFNRLLDVLEATGTRQNVGSRTAYNAASLKDQATSGIVGETAKGFANPFGRGAQFIADRYERYRLGANLNELADILTRPDAVNQLRAIARMPVGGGQARNTTIRLLTAANTETQAVNQRGQQ